MDFTGQHVVITGASTGIGKATAERIVALGGTVTLIARSADKLGTLAAALGERVRYVTGDMGRAGDITSVLDHAAETQGPIDALFLNAGTGGEFAPLEATQDATLETVLAVNLLGPFHAIRHILPSMKQRGRGAILVTGSLASERGMAMNAPYVMSKHGVLGLARAAALEAAPHGVRVNCVVPGFIDTPMMGDIPEAARAQLSGRIPQGRMGQPEELAQVAAFLLSDAASHVTGQSWSVDGGVLGTLSV